MDNKTKTFLQELQHKYNTLQFPFGKYKGRVVGEIIEQDYQYIEFLMDQPWFRKFKDLYKTIYQSILLDYDKLTTEELFNKYTSKKTRPKCDELIKDFDKLTTEELFNKYVSKKTKQN